MKLSLLLTTAVVSCLMVPGVTFADGYGDVKGQFVLNGDIPELAPLVKKGDPAAKDPTVCAAGDVPDNSLVVNKDNKGIGNIVIFLGRAPKDIHPDLADPPAESPVQDQKACVFFPHMMHVRAGQVVNVKSADACAHNVRSTFLRNESFNFTISPNDRVGLECPIEASEPVPAAINCDIHPYMRAYWLITDHPYAAITDENGNFEIKGLPAGKHKFRVWHEKFGGTGGGYIDRKFTVEVVADETTDAGVTEVDVAKFLE